MINPNRTKDPYKLFWYWVCERHNIYVRREQGKEWPWTKDKILQTYKFTNVYRELDAVSKVWWEQIGKYRALKPWDILWRTELFRLFNWPPTWDLLVSQGLDSKWNTRRAKTVLTHVKNKGHKVFTGAYMITNSGQTIPKIDYACQSAAVYWNNCGRMTKRLIETNTMQGAVEILREQPMLGAFTAYEVACDLRWTKILENATDIQTWANPGPGARRGIHRILFGQPKKPGGPVVDYQREMQDLLSCSQYNTKDMIQPLRRMEMRDIEHSLCEFDKWMRVRLDQGRPRSKYHRPEKDYELK